MSIEVSRLSKSFGRRRVLHEVSFAIGSGSVAGLLGPNGAGKTTIMRVLAGYYLPDQGSVVLNGRNALSDRLAARADVGYLPEAANGFQHLSVYDFLSTAAECRGLWGEGRDGALRRVADELDLEDVLDRPCGELSKGWRQRVWLAQALVHEPSVLLLDEPTDGLDPNQKTLLRNYIRKLARTKTILVSTHILEEAEEMCDRIVVLNEGRLMANAASDELMSDGRRLGPAYMRLTQRDLHPGT